MKIHLSHIWIRFKRDKARWRWDMIKWDAFYSDEALLLKHIWITSELNLNEISELNLDKIWVRSEQKKDEMQFNMMMHRRNWNTFESNMS